MNDPPKKGKKEDETEGFKEGLKEVMSEEATPAAMAAWNASRFSHSQISTKDKDESVLGGYFLAAAKKRPILASIGLMATLVILAVNLLALARHLNLTHWNPVAYDGDARPVTEASRRESRQTALSLLDRGALGEGGDVPTDELMSSALQGSNQLVGGLIQPKLPEGLGGILNPGDEDDRKKLKKVKGVELDATNLSFGGPAANMHRTMVDHHVDAEEELRNYQGPYYKSGGVKEAKTPRGVYFGEAGDNLENYASISNSPKGSAGFMAPDRYGDHPTAPEGTTGAELAHAMIGDGFLDEIRQYAKEGTWRMKRHDGSEQQYDEIDGNALYTSFAAGQLFEAQNESNKVLKCGQCSNEKRVYKGRATFYGEKY